MILKFNSYSHKAFSASDYLLKKTWIQNIHRIGNKETNVLANLGADLEWGTELVCKQWNLQTQDQIPMDSM